MSGAADVHRLEHNVAVGLVGPHDLLRRIVLAAGLPGASDPGVAAVQGIARPRRRLLLAAYRSEAEAAERTARLSGTADGYLFASRVPLEYATKAGAVRGPAAAIQLAGGPLLATLLAASRAGIDPSRASFDTFSRDEVLRALADFGARPDDAHVREGIAGPPAIASYHARLWRIGQTTAAITCLEEVARRLAAAGVPAYIVRPTDPAIASALHLATLLAERQVQADSQLVIAVIEAPVLREAATVPASRHDTEELRLAVHALLVRQAQQIGSVVSRVSEHEFLVIGTVASITAEEADLRFAAPAAQELGVALRLGVGTGRTARGAEEDARLRLGQARTSTGSRASIAVAATQTGEPAPGADIATAGRTPRGASRTKTGRRGMAGHVPLHAIPPGPPERAQGARVAAGSAQPGSDSLGRLRSLETLARLAQKLATDATPVVDAELTGQLLSVTPRTARRRLRSLADQGLALPLPPSRTQHPGRPRQAYRLVVEKLTS